MIADLSDKERVEFFHNQIREARQQVLEIIDYVDNATNHPDWIELQNTPIGRIYFKLNHLENDLCW